MQRLINASPADRVAKALTALGRLAKTIHICYSAAVSSTGGCVVSPTPYTTDVWKGSP